MPAKSRQKTRRDPYTNFNFIVAVGVAVVGIAAVAITVEAIRRRSAGPEGARRNSYWRMFG